MFFNVTFTNGTTKVFQAHNKEQLLQALRHVDWAPRKIMQLPGYYAMSNEFGYSAAIHRWIYGWHTLDDKEEMWEIYREQWASRVERIYSALKDTFNAGRRTSKRARSLILPIHAYAQKLHVKDAILLSALAYLREQGRITARRIPHRPHVPESWAISFIGHP